MRDDQTYIKLYRSMFDWDWWDDINVRSLWITILLMANWKDKNWRGVVIKKGSFFTSLDHLSKKAGLSVRSTRTALDKLKSTGEITIESTSRGTLITVENWGDFQDNPQEATNELTSELTNDRQTSDKPPTSERQQLKKDRKKERKNNLNIYSDARPTLEDIVAYIEEKKLTVDAKKFYDYFEASEWIDSMGNPVRSWKQKLITWSKHDVQHNFRANDSKRGGFSEPTERSGRETKIVGAVFPRMANRIEEED